jgi:tetratricopeptide (TPR) repeat protein
VAFRETPGGILYDVKDRALFDKKSVRRLELTKTIGVLVAKRPNRGYFEVQAIRFDKSAFDQAAAEKWVQDNLNISNELLEKMAKKEILPAQVLGVSPEEQKVLAALGFDAIAKQNLERARKIFSGLVALNPASNLGHTGMGKVLHIEGKLDEALKSYDEALKANADDVEALYGKARILLTRGQKKPALPLLLEILYIDQAYAEPVSYEAQTVLFDNFTLDDLADFVQAAQDGKLVQVAKDLQSGGARPAAAAAARPAAAGAARPAQAPGRPGPLNLGGRGSPLKA